MTSGKRGIAGDVLKLAGGTAFSQILGILAMPILTRIYGPDCFGVAALFSSIIGILTIVACLRYDLAILLPAENDVAANVLGISLAGTVLTSLFALVAVVMAGGTIARLMKASELESYLWLIAPMVFLSGAFQALNYWNSRTSMYGRLAVARTAQSFITNGTQIMLGFLVVAYAGGLIWGMVFGTMAVTCILGFQIWKDDAALFRRSIRWKSMLEVMKHYRKFPLVDLWGSLLNVVSTQLPVLLLGVYFSQATVGHFAMASRLIYLPMSLIGGAIGQVFFQRSAETNAKDEDLAELTVNIFKRLVTLTLLPSLMLTIVGKELFVLIFGSNWVEAGKYVEILSPWMFFWFVASPLTALFAVKQRLEMAFVVHVLLLATRIAPLVIGGMYGNEYLALTLYSASGVVAYAIVGMWSMRLAGVDYRGPVMILGKMTLRSVPAVALVLVLDVLLKAPNWLVLVAAGIGLLEYAWYVVRSDTEINRYFNSALGFLSRKAA